LVREILEEDLASTILTFEIVQSPTGSDYSGVAEVKNSAPWEQDGSSGKFKYYVKGDPNQGVKDHPSALNTVIIPNVTLPKVKELPSDIGVERAC
jgi:hypothetical protein